MITLDRPVDETLADELLVSAVLHLVGQTRAFLHLLESARDEIGSLHDERAVRLLESLNLTLRVPVGPGTLRHVEAAASELLHLLRDST